MLKIIYFVCLSYLLIAADVVRCKPGYLYSSQAGGWLKLHAIPATWEEAYLRCHSDGAVLASPLNIELTKALHSKLDDFGGIDRIFLGIHDLYSKGHFVSVEGVSLSDMEIEWRSHRPGANTADCLTMSLDGNMYYMNTSSCDDPLPFICYRKFDNQTMNECGTFDNEYHLKEYTGNCYKVHRKIQSWSRAYGICASEGGHLVILNDAEEARIVKDMFPAVQTYHLWDRFHVGLGAWSDDRVWTTIHGQSFEEVFNTWNVGQPNNLGYIQTRGSFVRDGALDDIQPAFKAMFVCEKSPTSMQYEAAPLSQEDIELETPSSN